MSVNAKGMHQCPKGQKYDRGYMHNIYAIIREYIYPFIKKKKKLNFYGINAAVAFGVMDVKLNCLMNY